MALVKDKVLVLKGINYSEADKIITVLGRNRGKFSLMAKGVRKIDSKNRPAVQTLSSSSITYYEGKNLGVLVEAQLDGQYEPNSEEIKEVAKVLLILNKLLPEDEQDMVLFDKVLKLTSEELDLRSVNKFRFWVLEHLGYLPDMRSCVKCGRKDRLDHVDIHNMVMICSECKGTTANGSKYKEVASLRFESSEMDQALDKFVQAVIDG